MTQTRQTDTPQAQGAGAGAVAEEAAGASRHSTSTAGSPIPMAASAAAAVAQQAGTPATPSPAPAPAPVPARAKRSRSSAFDADAPQEASSSGAGPVAETEGDASASASAPAPAAAAGSGSAVDVDAFAVTSSTSVRRGGRVAAVAEVRPAQVEAMQRVATQSVHGVECPSWYPFKRAEFVAKRAAAIGPGRQWRNVRQILDRENFHLMPPNASTYVSVRSSPSVLPPRRYCDVTGLPAPYTDARTRLHLHSASEFASIRGRSTDTIKLMLELRGQTPTHQLLLR